MSKQYDVAQPRDYTDRNGEKKTSWQNLGRAFEKDGRISILLNALPMPGQDGRAKLVLMEPRQNDGDQRNDRGQPARREPTRSAAPQPADLDDDVPF